MIESIRRSLSTFTPSERRIGEAILDTPSTAITWTIADIARIADVSEPTVVRFCRRIGCSGLPDFRLRLAQELAARQPDPPRPDGSDPFSAMVDDVFARAIATIREAREDLDLTQLRRAVELLRRARRVDIYGYGGSGFLAAEAQHRLAALGVPSVAYADPTLQMVSAPRLGPEDVLLVLSFSGRTSYLIANIELARNAGATVVAISPKGSIVAELSDVNLSLNAYRQSSRREIVPSGRASMYVLIEALFSVLEGASL